MDSLSVVLDAPGSLSLRRLALNEPGPADVVVDTLHTGISTGTERLLWSGRMPAFPGMGYPLVPGYEAVGRVVEAGPDATHEVDTLVFVPGAKCYRDARSLFGAASARLIVPSDRVTALGPTESETGVLMALAATAMHAVAAASSPPDLIIGHGVLGRLLARTVVARGAPAPVVWEVDPARQSGADGYGVVAPDDDARRDYRVICDASGAAWILDVAIGRLATGARWVL
jgi:bacteriochlorophyllide a dehydrogenase